MKLVVGISVLGALLAAAPQAARQAPQVTTAPVSHAPANRPPTVRAACDPCTVEMGKVSTVSADAQDPDGDPLTYRWTADTGSFTSPTNRQTPWTAPMLVGPVSVTVTLNDGRGGTASANVTIQVVQPAVNDFVFEDVHFEFDRYTLRPDALRVLDEAIAAMQVNANLRLEIEGHTCNIGTAEHNLALGERRAAAVREHLTSRAISADRLRIVSYGEERPKHDNAREETRRLNRRAALVVRVQ
ncbi:MAG: OmpA family protein [Vicinamibacterales bacterium]